MSDIVPVIVTATPTPIPTLQIVPDPTLLVQYGNQTFTYYNLAYDPPLGCILLFIVGIFFGFLIALWSVIRD